MFKTIGAFHDICRPLTRNHEHRMSISTTLLRSRQWSPLIGISYNGRRIIRVAALSKNRLHTDVTVSTSVRAKMKWRPPGEHTPVFSVRAPSLAPVFSCIINTGADRREISRSCFSTRIVSAGTIAASCHHLHPLSVDQHHAEELESKSCGASA